MRPAWQVDTVSTQLKYLEAQKDHLSSLVNQIDATIHDVKVWIKCRINKTVSFTEMCTFIESTFSDVSTKCLDIYREHQYDPVNSEDDDEDNDPQILAGTASGQPYSKRNIDVKQDRSTGKGTMTDDTRKEKVVQKSRRTKTNKCNTTDDPTEHFPTELNNIKHTLDLFGQDLENVKINEFENSHKLESIFNTLSDYNKLISDMQLKIDLIQKSQHETNAALKELSDFASHLKTDVEILSLEVKSTDSKLHSFVDELKNDSENIKQKLSNSQDQLGSICQLLKKKIIYMEQLRNILNTTKSFRDEQLKTIAQSKSGILTEKLKFKLKSEHCKDAFQEDDTDCSPKEDGTDDICNLKDESSIFYGTHETQVSEGGEADLHKHVVSCKKNPGHTKFVPVNDFNINHLPKGHHDNDIVEYIKAVADLTVRVDVKMTSRKRPEFWPNTNQPYPFYDKRGSDVMRLGTGMLWYVNKPYNNETCRCLKCQHSDTPSKVWGEVSMCTATQVVFDDLEARHTTCRLFYDRQDSPLVTLDGWTVIDANIEDDWCRLKCVTCDVDLRDKLDNMVRHWEDLYEKVYNKYWSYRDKVNLTFIVSHPHGCPKQISVGQWLDRCKVSDDRTKYTYTTCTCPGSSGAYVHSLGYCAHHVHSGVNSEGINFSGTGWGLD